MIKTSKHKGKKNALNNIIYLIHISMNIFAFYKHKDNRSLNNILYTKVNADRP